MNTEQNLIDRLMISKKIMDKHNGMDRGQASGGLPQTPQLENYQPVDAKYNIPSEFVNEEVVAPRQINNEMPTEDRILNSRLPDEIKQLMIEHPIEKPSMGVHTNVGLSDDLIERASRLMGTNNHNSSVNESTKTPPTNNSMDIKQIIKETVQEVLKENGLLTESESKSNEQFKFRVGQHIFEGRLTKVKKIPK
jgi:hypothetical protein